MNKVIKEIVKENQKSKTTWMYDNKKCIVTIECEEGIQPHDILEQCESTIIALGFDKSTFEEDESELE